MKTKPYRNKFETRIAEVLGDRCKYEPKKIPYTTHRNYTPDYVGNHNSQDVELIIEAKGFFRVGDVQKYKAIRDSLEVYQQLIFTLYTPNKKLRKGSKMTMADWCVKEGLDWYTVENVLDAFDN